MKHAFKYLRRLCCSGLLIGTLAGCATLAQFLPGQREGHAQALRVQQLQTRVMRFADEYAGRSREAIASYQAQVQDARERLIAQEWKVQQSQAAYTIASGANPLVNMLDMVVLATLSRMVVEDVWIKRDMREQGRRIHEMHAALEQGAWKLVEGALSDSQQSELRLMIDRWRDEHPHVTAVPYIHFADFAAVSQAAHPERQSAGNLLSLFGLDLLSGLDPAVREIAQTRELAERSIFYLQRAPALLELQAERLAYQITGTPEATAMLQNAERISHVGSASDRLVTMLPDLLAHERSAAIRQLYDELELRSGGLENASRDIRLTLLAAMETVTAVDIAMGTVDKLLIDYKTMRRDSTQGSESQTKPIDLLALLQDTQATIKELDSLVTNIDSTLPRANRLMQDAKTGVEAILDRLFVMLLMLLGTSLIGIVAAALGYQYLVRRMLGYRAS